MTVPSDSDYPIAQLKALLSDRAKLNLSPIELAEILWLASQRSEGRVPRPETSSSSEATPIAVVQIEDSPVTVSSEFQPAQPTAAIVAEPPKPQGQDEPSETVLPVNIPAAVALRNRRDIARSLRPLMRKVPSKFRQAIDEEATVLQIAEDNTWSPVVKPEPERWLELAIVVEVTNLLEVWRDPIAEFQHLMARHGAFRDVRTWQLQPDDRGKPQLFLQTAAGLKGKPRSARELMDAGGRRLILLLSDCTSQAWRSGEIPKLLQQWSRQNPVTIAQLLPEHYWDRSALGLGYPVALRSRQPGALSRDWQMEGLSQRRRQRLREGLKVPIVTIEPQSLGQWAKATAVVGEQPTTGIVLGAQIFAESNSVAEPEPLTAKQLVRRFRGTASAKAQELADMMAVLPVNWSVLRLIQKNLGQMAGSTQETGALHLAEIFLSGLLYPVAMSAEPDRKPGTTQQYDFVEGVREVLLGAIPISEAQAVGESIATQIFRQLPQAVQDRVNEDIARRFGESPGYFQAFLVPDLDWGEDAAAEMLPFARVTGQVLRRWGGNYAALAESLERGGVPTTEVFEDASPSTLPVSFPPLQTLDFTTAQLVEPNDLPQFPPLQTQTIEVVTITFEDELEGLQPFEFESATIVRRTEEQQAGFLKGLRNLFSRSEQQSDWVIRKQRRQAYQFIQPLGDTLQLEMVSIPAGRFVMGAPDDEPERTEAERPQHEVTVSTFFMGRYPVTQAQWQFVTSLPQVNRELSPKPSNFKGDNRPVEKVSWDDAVEFCDRLSAHTGRPYRLPTEAEWEYACRARTTTPFHFGETITTELANYNGSYTYNDSPKGEYRKTTTPVDHFGIANAFGLCDMHGNVREWCQDHWHSSYEGAPTDGSAWLSENENASRVLRGGSWDYGPWYCRSAFRLYHTPGHRDYYVGFRVVCSAPRTL